jgi:hypothetical protein
MDITVRQYNVRRKRREFTPKILINTRNTKKGKGMLLKQTDLFIQDVENRLVRIEKTETEGYSIKTTQFSDNPGSITEIDGSTIIIPPSAAGQEIEWEAENIDSLCTDLLTEGFSQTAVDNIRNFLLGGK